MVGTVAVAGIAVVDVVVVVAASVVAAIVAVDSVDMGLVAVALCIPLSTLHYTLSI